MLQPEDLVDDVNVVHEFYKLRSRFLAMCRDEYPGVLAPDVCWLFDRLGIDPYTVLAEPITKKHYYAFMYDENGKTLYDANHRVKKRKVAFTDEQRTVVAEWWPLLDDKWKN